MHINILIKLLSILFILILQQNNIVDGEQSNYKEPSVAIITLVRNKAHTLPYFFTYLENFNYPKHRISIWIRSDHNEDKSIEICKIWVNASRDLYNEIDFEYLEEPARRENETTMFDWPDQRFADFIHLKEEGLAFAKRVWADYAFFVDADVFLTAPNTLSHLISLKLPVVAPLLLSDGLYSNFWGAMDNFYYKRTDEYKEILEHKKVGEFQVPMIHSAFLIDMNLESSDFLTFDKRILQKYINYTGPIDDMIVFALSANYSNIPLYISNSEHYGYIMVPIEKDDDLYRDLHQMINLKTLIISNTEIGLVIRDDLHPFILYPTKDTLDLGEIYMINLERRPDRRRKMEQTFYELGLLHEYVAGVDGKNLTDEAIEEMGIKFLPNYADPYHKRPMTMGEVGCFLSHYKIWKKMVDNNIKDALILEDDIRFEPYFKPTAQHYLKEAKKVGGWDLIYIGRKRLQDVDEPYVNNANNLVHAGYSYWTLGYILTLEGAKKLVNAKPLEKLVPVDEYLPIMFDKHPNADWKNEFEPRDLVAYSFAPLLIYPTHYTGEEGYISDTEDSDVIKNDGYDFGAADDDAQKKGDKEQDFEPYKESTLEESLDCKNDKCANILSPPPTLATDDLIVKEAHTEL